MMSDAFWTAAASVAVIAIGAVSAAYLSKRKRDDPLRDTVMRYAGEIEGGKMRVKFDLGDGSSVSMLLDRNVAQKMSDDLLIGVARIDVGKTGEAAPTEGPK